MFLWQDTGLKNGKVLVLYIVSYFHDIRFQVDHVWNIRRPSFANLKENRGLKDRQPGPEGNQHGTYMLFCFK